MNAKHWIANLLVSALVLAGAGCKKKEPSPPPPAVDSVKAANAVGNESPGTVEAAKPAGENAVGESTPPAPPPRAAGRVQAQDLIDRARSLVAANQYRDAMFALRQAAVFKLTAEQRKIVEDLRIQIQQGLAGKPTGGRAATPGNVPGGNR